MPRLIFASHPKVRPSHWSRPVGVSTNRSLVPILISRIDCILLLPRAVVIARVVFAVPLNQAHDIGERLEVLLESLPGA
jgi:hypothetical protein